MATDLTRFVEAQADTFAMARDELIEGAKRSHWMWYVFPQLGALGRSGTARFYGLDSLAAARDYMAHPVLGPRLADLTGIVLRHRATSARAIFGTPDDIKFRSSMTLFALAAPDYPEFRQAIAAFYDGPDPVTLDLLAAKWAF